MLVKDLGNITERRICSVPRGSWRWENKYSIGSYSPRPTKDGRFVWDGRCPRKGMGVGIAKRNLPHGMGHGSLYNIECTQMINKLRDEIYSFDW